MKTKRPRAAKARIERLSAVEGRLADLEARIARLEAAPFKDWPNEWPRPFAPDHEKAPLPSPLGGTTCRKCGMVWHGVMGYVCSEFDCPMGAGPTWCATVTFGGESMSPAHLPSYKSVTDKTQP
jgi:hypothetical protein